MTDTDPQRREEIGAKIAANIRSALAWRGISARRAGVLLGLSQAAMNRRMSGEVAFDVYDLTMLSGMTGISASHLIEGEPWSGAEVAPSH